MSSKIVGWLVGDWDGKLQILKKKSERKKYSEKNLKKGNPTFLPKVPTYRKATEIDYNLKLHYSNCPKKLRKCYPFQWYFHFLAKLFVFPFHRHLPYTFM